VWGSFDLLLVRALNYGSLVALVIFAVAELRRHKLAL